VRELCDLIFDDPNLMHPCSLRALRGFSSAITKEKNCNQMVS
jgi:hypothetical protein